MAIPFLKWPGGKRWFIEKYSQFLPGTYNRYIEPFLGGGSVFFSLTPHESILADVNQDLIDTYLAIRGSWEAVYKKLKVHQKKHKEDYYYKTRESNPRSIDAKAAKFIYLNRTCWNGLYRVNTSGKFNVPIGTKTSVLLSTDNFEETSNILRGAQIDCGDFEAIVDRSERDDFVFIDPPYTVKHSNNGFIKYNEKLFTWDDQVRLSKAVRRARDRGAQICLLNAEHDSIRELYPDFEHIPLSRKSLIAARSENRGNFSELLIRG
jgi:DNA adenine methylase